MNTVASALEKWRELLQKRVDAQRQLEEIDRLLQPASAVDINGAPWSLADLDIIDLIVVLMETSQESGDMSDELKGRLRQQRLVTHRHTSIGVHGESTSALLDLTDGLSVVTPSAFRSALEELIGRELTVLVIEVSVCAASSWEITFLQLR